MPKEADAIRYHAFTLRQDRARNLALIEFTLPDLRLGAVLQTLEGQFTDAAARVRTSRVILDLSTVTHAPSAVFGLLFQLAADLKREAIALRLCGLAPTMRRVFDILNARHVLDVVADRHDALTRPWPDPGKKRWWSWGEVG